MLGGWWVANLLDQSNGAVLLASWVVVVVGSIVLHELAHGWAAIYKGDRTPIELGHMTWNPLVHMGQTSLILFLVFGFAFGAMPVSPSRFRGRYAEAFVAAAGPAMNALLALVCIVLGGVVVGLSKQIGEPLSTNLTIFFTFGVALNVALMLFNLLPILPLDGGRILGNISRDYARLWESENAQWVAFGLFIVAFMFGGKYVLPLGIQVASEGIGFVAGMF
jgi:Zn-dependent protease